MVHELRRHPTLAWSTRKICFKKREKTIAVQAAIQTRELRVRNFRVLPCLCGETYHVPPEYSQEHNMILIWHRAIFMRANYVLEGPVSEKGRIYRADPFPAESVS